MGGGGGCCDGEVLIDEKCGVEERQTVRESESESEKEKDG